MTVVRACRVMLEECCVTVALVQPGHVSGSGRGQGRQSPARSTPVACTRAPRASGALARPSTLNPKAAMGFEGEREKGSPKTQTLNLEKIL